MDIILKPVRVATSKPARQTYLNTLLFVITSTILLGVAVIAYILFYFNYIPQIGIERVIHLQYGDGPHPYGIATLDSSLVNQQPYDISISLHVPRSPPNVAAGNFMLALSLLSPTYIPRPPTTEPLPILQSPTLTSSLLPTDIIYTSRRPTLLTYTSDLIALSDRLLSLPLYILGLRQESEILRVPMAEQTSFSKGYKNTPAYVLLELQAGQAVQVYDVRVHFTARFGGIRWMMYNHRVISFVVFTSAFWFFEMLFTGLGWLALRYAFSRSGGGSSSISKIVKGEERGAGEGGIKTEAETDDPDISDTPRTFPTYGSQAPLRYEPTRVKEEEISDLLADTEILPLAAEADDEEDDFGVRGVTDSGLGTSYDEGSRSKGVTRRKSRGGRLG